MPASAQGRRDWRPASYRPTNTCASVLLPKLRANPRDRAFVIRNSDRNGDSRVNPREADCANAGFVGASAVLRPGAQDKLVALAHYRHEERRVRVATGGFTDARGTDARGTDARGTDAHNQRLSERPAMAVRDTFDRLGVTHARFGVVCHREGDSVATNATGAGMRRNRRKEVMPRW